MMANAKNMQLALLTPTHDRKEKKAKYASIKQRKGRKNIVLINLQLIFINKGLCNNYLEGGGGF